MTYELAQAIRDLARFGRLSEESEENLSAILDEKDDDTDDDTKKSEPPTKAGTTSVSTGKDK